VKGARRTDPEAMPVTFEADPRTDLRALRAEVASLRRQLGFMRSEAGRRKMHAEEAMREHEHAAFVDHDEAALRRWLWAYGAARACEAVLAACADASRYTEQPRAATPEKGRP